MAEASNVLKNPQQEQGGGRLLSLLTLPTLSEFRHGLPVCLRCATDAQFNATEAWLTEATAHR